MTFRKARWEAGRKLIHAGSAIFALGYWWIGRERSIVVLALMLMTMLIIELLRIHTAWGKRLYGATFGPVTRPTEGHSVTGATFVFGGALLAALLFEPRVAVLAMLFMSLGDTAASVVGTWIGRIKVGHKTLEGTLACFVVCLLVALPTGLPMPVIITGAIAATLAELLPAPALNDNIGIPLISGLAMTFLMSGGL